MSQKRNLIIHKTKTILFHSITLIAIILVLGVTLENVWVSIAGFLGLVAIGFFAVWSILSNIFAGITIFFNRPFVIEDKIEIMPDGIQGRVRDINSYFVVLEDDEGNSVNIPNNMIFQKVVKKISTRDA
jgi:small-conductance mechanosensitive channel